MSDDRLLGRVCHCVPTRVFALIIGGLVFFDAFRDFVYIIVWQWLIKSEVSFSPPKCHTLACEGVLSCDGLRQASFYIINIVYQGGGIIFGYFGISGAISSKATEMHAFSLFLAALTLVYIANYFFDWAYLNSCEAYSYNTIDQGLLWSIPNIPVHQGVKMELRHMAIYPVGYLSNFVHAPVFMDYTLVMILSAAFFGYSSRVIWKLASICAFGPFGLGAQYDIGHWRERLMFRDKVHKEIAHTIEQATNTFEDLDWLRGGRPSRRQEASFHDGYGTLEL